jgi:hypothetical protein
VERWCAEIESVFERHLIPPEAEARTIGLTRTRVVTAYIMPTPEPDSVLAAPPAKSEGSHPRPAHPTPLQTDGVLTRSTSGNGQLSRRLQLISRKSPKSFHPRTGGSREHPLSQTYAENNIVTAPGRTSPLVIELSPEDGQTLTS